MIDDVSGTLPPYDRHIVLGPTRASETAQAIAMHFPGVGAAVVDANDLGKVDVLGASTGLNSRYVARCLTGNPAGNSDERTPIVILRQSRLKDPNRASYGTESSPRTKSMSYLISPQNPFFSDPGSS